MKLKRKTVLLLVILSLLCVSLIVGVSYSIYQLDQKQTTPNIIQVGCFTIEFEDYANFVNNQSPWFERGARSVDGQSAGIYAYSYNTGMEGSCYSFRVVLTDE